MAECRQQIIQNSGVREHGMYWGKSIVCLSTSVPSATGGRTDLAVVLRCSSAWHPPLTMAAKKKKPPTATAHRSAAYSEPTPLSASLPLSAPHREDPGESSCSHTVRLTYSPVELKDFSATSPSADYTLLNRLRRLKMPANRPV